MAAVVQPIIEPDVEAIGAHLAFLFTPCVADYPNGLVEIAHGADGRLTSANLFPMTKQGMAEAVAYAVEQNRRGENVYVGVNPRKPGTADNKRASTKDIEIAFFHFADLDQEEQVTLARHRMPIKPGLVVMTGTKPSNRPHLYWQLEEPVGNLIEWSARQRGIAQTLGGDMVIDPPRIMRLGGTVNYPTPDKLMKRGYAVELVTVKTEFADERAPVTPDQIAAAFPIQPSENIGQLTSEPQQLNGGTTLALMARSRSAELIAACKAGNQWHNNMRDLVAHLAGIGTPSPVILALAAEITLPGFAVSDTHADMLIALRGAREKWGIAEPDEAVAIQRKTEETEGVYHTLSLDELEALPPPTYLIDEVVPEHGLTILYGPSGSCKSFIAIDMSLRVAFGMDWHGVKTKQCGVLYIAGEGKHGLGKRVRGWRREHALEGIDAPFKLLPVAVHMLDRPSVEKLKRTILAVQEELDFRIGLVVIDTVSRAIPGQDENKQDVMSLFVDGCAEIDAFTDGAVMGVHHTGKDADRGMRGSSVLLGGIEASIKVTKDEKTVTLEVEKQKDDEEAAPIYMTMKKLEWASGMDKPTTTLIPEKAGKQQAAAKTLSKNNADEIFDEITRARQLANPWSVNARAKTSGRYFPDWIAEKYDVPVAVAKEHLEFWLRREYLIMSKFTTRSESKGLEVLKKLER